MLWYHCPFASFSRIRRHSCSAQPGRFIQFLTRASSSELSGELYLGSVFFITHNPSFPIRLHCSASPFPDSHSEEPCGVSAQAVAHFGKSVPSSSSSDPKEDITFGSALSSNPRRLWSYYKQSNQMIIQVPKGQNSNAPAVCSIQILIKYFVSSSYATAQ